MTPAEGPRLPRQHLFFERAAMALVLIFSAIFILRQAIPILGESYYVLFDDAMISMTYARNLAEGHGLTWFPGTPPVEGFTNPLWTVLMAGVHALPIHESKTSLVVMIASIPLLLAIMVLVAKICDELTPGDAAARTISAALAGTYYGMAYWSLRGMEVGLMSVLVLWGYLLVLRLARETTPARGASLCGVLILLVLLRMDGLVPGLVLAGGVFWMLKGRVCKCMPIAMVCAMGATLGVMTIWRHEYYGEWLPNTYYLKLTGVPAIERWSRGMRMLVDIVWLHLWWPMALAAFGLYRSRRDWVANKGTLLALALFAVQCAYSAHVGGDAWEGLQIANRYICVAIPLLTMLAANGLLRAVREYRDEPDRRTKLLQLILFAAAIEATFSAGRLLLIKDVSEELTPGRITAWRYVIAGIVAMIAAAIVIGSGRLAGAMHQALHRHGFPDRLAQSLRADGASLRTLAAIFFVVWVPLNFNATQRWMYEGASLESAEPDMVRLGLYLRATTPATTTAAVTWAGTVPYFSRRQCFDFLGKCDPAIARAAPARDFYPGHNKWNFKHTIGKLRPSLIVQTPHITKLDLDYFLSEGYRWMENTIFIRMDDKTLEPAKISRDWTQQDELDEALMIAGGKKFLGFM
jgi:hypothetical protein